MKYIFATLIGFILLFGCVQAQSNLSFNRVHIVKGLHTGGWTVVDSVPAGKVWKVEAVGTSGYLLIGTEVTPSSILSWNINTNIPIHLISPTGSSNQGTLVNPVWLNAGEKIYVNRTNTGNGQYYISVLEFNVTP